MISFEEFKHKMYVEFKKEYDNTVLNEDSLTIQKGTVEAIISLDFAYEEYKMVRDFEYVKIMFMNTLQEEFDKLVFKIDYTKIYPIIKSKDFATEVDKNFVRDNLFLDLDVLYAMDMGEKLRFIVTEDKYNYIKLKESAYINLENLTSGLIKLDNELEIYSVPFLTDYTPSFLLIDKIKNKIEKKVGKNYLFAIPSSTSLLVAKDNVMYIDILRTLSEVDPDPYRVSSNIYRCKDGIFEYADKKQIFTVK